MGPGFVFFYYQPYLQAWPGPSSPSFNPALTSDGSGYCRTPEPEKARTYSILSTLFDDSGAEQLGDVARLNVEVEVGDLDKVGLKNVLNDGAIFRHNLGTKDFGTLENKITAGEFSWKCFL